MPVDLTVMAIGSITPNVASIRGGTRLTIRGRCFKSSSIKVSFTSIDGSTSFEGIAASYLSAKVIEVTSPNCVTLCQGDKNHVYVTISCGGTLAKGKRKLVVEQKCTIVRKCMKPDGHSGRCCSDPPPPMYGSYAAPDTPGGKIGTALLGYRLKDKHKPNSLPGPRPPPQKKEIPGGVIARTPRICATGIIGGINESRLRLAKESTAPIVILPGFGAGVPGGKIGTALLGYRCKDKHKPNSLPGPRPPPARKEIPGGVIARTPRKCATGVLGGINEARLRLAKESTTPILMLKGFAEEVMPGGRFNMSGSKKKKIHEKSGPGPGGSGTLLSGCGQAVTPGGRFNMSGSKKKIFRQTFLDYAGYA
jgi:hypothetical protein